MNDAIEFLQRHHGELADVRRDLHAHPELGFEEHRTARIVCETLTRFGIRHHAGVGRTGIVAVIEGREDNGLRVGLRAYRAALERGVVLRPLGDILYWMPPYCVDDAQLELLARTTAEAIAEATACA